MQLRGPFVVLASWIGAASCPGAEPAASPIGFDALQARLGSAGLRLLDPRPRGIYDAGHLPGAVRVDSKAARAAWEAWLKPPGIGPEDES